MLVGTVGVVTRLTMATSLRLGKVLTQHPDHPGRFYRATLGREPVTAWVVHATDDLDASGPGDPFDGEHAGRGSGGDGTGGRSPMSELRESTIAMMAEDANDMTPLSEDEAWDVLHKQISAIRYALGAVRGMLSPVVAVVGGGAVR